MNAQQIKQTVRIIDFLESKGIHPDHVKSDYDYWYKSPLRDEKTASFHVHSIKNVWFDQGLGKGGTIIDLIMKMYSVSFTEAIAIAQNNSLSPEVKKNIFHIEYETLNKDLGMKECCFVEISSDILTKYIKNRWISLDLINKYCSEVSYFRTDKSKRKFINIAFKNDSCGYELNGAYYTNKITGKIVHFRGCIIPKDITTIQGFENLSKKVVLFEGFFDFLSYLMHYDINVLNFDVIVINSTAIIKKAINRIKENKYQEIEMFFDNDQSGYGASKTIEEDFPFAKNLSKSLFPNEKDFNSFFVKKKNTEYDRKWRR